MLREAMVSMLLPTRPILTTKLLTFRDPDVNTGAPSNIILVFAFNVFILFYLLLFILSEFKLLKRNVNKKAFDAYSVRVCISMTENISLVLHFVSCKCYYYYSYYLFEFSLDLHSHVYVI
jgi:hypothetical protein